MRCRIKAMEEYWVKGTDLKVVPETEDTVFSFWWNGRESERVSDGMGGNQREMSAWETD